MLIEEVPHPRIGGRVAGVSGVFCLEQPVEDSSGWVHVGALIP